MRRGKLKQAIVFMAMLLTASLPLCGLAQDHEPVFEIPYPGLPDIAVVRAVEGVGTVIFYNPVLCAQAGQELCEFFRMHEYGHIAMGHLRVACPDDETRKREEAEADRWAAQHAATHAVQAAHRHFQAGGGETPVHGTGRQRAARIALYAGIAPAGTAHSHAARPAPRIFSAQSGSSRAAGLRPAP